MKKLLGCFLCVMLLGFLAAPAGADILVPDPNGPSLLPNNPQNLPNSGWATEEAWLNDLLGNPTTPVKLLWEDDNGSDGWQAPSNWTYAVLKYGAPQAPDAGLDHYAIYNDDGGGIDFAGLSTHALSHVRYDSVPEPATMLLLGTGIFGLALFGRQRFKK